MPKYTVSTRAGTFDIVADREPTQQEAEELTSSYSTEGKKVDDMAKNALKILSEPKTLNLFKKKAWIHSHSFTLKKVLPLYEALYDKVLTKYEKK